MLTLKIGDFAKGDFPFALNEPSPQSTYPEHVHDFVELVIVRSGRGIHVVGGDEYVIESGDVFVVTGALSHAYRDTKDLKIVNILLEPKGLSLPLDYLSELPGFHALFSVEPKLRKRHEFKSRLKLAEDQMATVNFILNRIKAEMKAKSAGYKALVAGMLTELLVFLARSYFSRRATGDALAVARMGQVVSRIETGFRTDIALDDLAAIAHMSTRTFLRCFNSVFGMSPIQYLLKVRLDKACDLLLTTDKPISEVALETGFLDGNYFSRHFKKGKGMSPRRFRHLKSL